jgi:hypothetical protein
MWISPQPVFWDAFFVKNVWFTGGLGVLEGIVNSSPSYHEIDELARCLPLLLMYIL